MARLNCARLPFMIDQRESGLFLTIPSAARRMGVGEARLRRAIETGQVRTVTISKQKLIPRAALERLALLEEEPA